MTATESKVKKCVEPIINDLGYKVYDVIYEKEGKDNYLRIFIDKETGISLNDCENVNNAITDILDEKDLIKNQYMLEISSPGIERRLRSDEHLKQNINSKVEVHTFKGIESVKYDKQKIFVGILKKLDEKTVTIEVENEEISISKDNISNIKTVFNWEE